MKRAQYYILIFFLVFLGFSCNDRRKYLELNVAYSDDYSYFIENYFNSDLFKKQKYKLNFIKLNSKLPSEALDNSEIDFYITDEKNKINQESFTKKLLAKDAVLVVANAKNSVSNITASEAENSVQTFKQRKLLSEFLINQSNSLADIRASKYKSNIAEKLVYVNDIAPIKSNFNFGNYPLMKRINLYYSSQSLKERNIEVKKFIKLLNSKKSHELIDALNFIYPNNELAIEKLSEKPIRIGIGMPLKNKYSYAGKSAVAAVQMFVDTINNKGGIAGRKIEVYLCDDGANIENALQAIDCAREFVSLCVDAVVGHLGSEASIATSKVYQDNNILQITPTAVHPGFTHQVNNQGSLFRAAPQDYIHYKPLLDSLLYIDSEVTENKKIIIHNGCLTHANIIAKLMSSYRSLKKNNITSYQLDANSESQIVDIFSESKLDTYLLLGPEYDLKYISKLLSQSNPGRQVNIVCFWHNILPYSNTYDLDYENTSLYIIGPKIDRNNLEFIELKNYFKDKKDVGLNYASILSYISAKALFSSLEDYHSGKYCSLAEAMHSKEFEVFGDKFSFNEYGDRIASPFAIYSYKNNSFEVLEL
ncbi:MAG: ABC transporter substrate-binding protein [Candidatus Caenarcaniphilales bacterium]|nr:ABC transporter substrate-binding protein [Candidatus Caenarcaniphilales bacterium]